MFGALGGVLAVELRSREARSERVGQKSPVQPRRAIGIVVHVDTCLDTARKSQRKSQTRKILNLRAIEHKIIVRHELGSFEGVALCSLSGFVSGFDVSGFDVLSLQLERN